MRFLVFLLIVVPLLAFTLDKRTTQKLFEKGQTKVIVSFNDPVNFQAASKTLGQNWDDIEEIPRGRLVVKLLKEAAERSQKRVIQHLKEQNIKFSQLWISNSIVIDQADMNVIQQLKTFANDIAEVEIADEVHLIKPVSQGPMLYKKDLAKTAVQRVEEGVEWVKAPEIWKKGYTGKSQVVGVIDTGAFLHEDLKRTYRGSQPGHSHEDSWYDPTTDNRRNTPYDDNIHGTHCHGTIGAKSDKQVLGVAPDSKWISCKFLTARGGGDLGDSVKCLQFMLAPGGNPDKRPNVVSNSWGGGFSNSAILRAIASLERAGVAVVFAGGNSGPRCRTMGFPGSDENVFSVGALNKKADTIAYFSSRGPSGFFGRIVKPDISAPGVNVLSTANSAGAYRALSGTSMACPHVSGVIALLWDAVPKLNRKVEATYKLLKETAKQQLSDECGTAGKVPNNVFGYGTVNALKAYEKAGSKSAQDVLAELLKQIK